MQIFCILSIAIFLLTKTTDKMKHTFGNKAQREFFARDGKPYEFVGISKSDGFDFYVVRCLVGDSDLKLIPDEEFDNEFTSITQGEVFSFINNDDDSEHAAMMDALGVGYICPFCGGRLAWESDFMASEMRGVDGQYVEVTEEEAIKSLSEHHDEYIRSGVMGVTDDIGPVIEKSERECDYPYMYMCEENAVDGETVRKYWVSNDSVIGIYTCMNCGKNYEVMDCLPSDEFRDPYFN